MKVCYNGTVGVNFYNDRDYWVCPVVSLKPNVKVEWKNEDGANSDNGYYEIVE